MIGSADSSPSSETEFTAGTGGDELTAGIGLAGGGSSKKEKPSASLE